MVMYVTMGLALLVPVPVAAPWRPANNPVHVGVVG